MIEELSKPEVKQFVLDHEQDDPSKLILAQSKYGDIPVQLVAAQIQSRKKARKKLPEWYSTDGVLFPHGVPIEQCSSEPTAKYKSELISGNVLVDLTGGTGVDTFYLSQQFKEAHYIEQSQQLCDLARHNFHALDTNIKVHHTNAESFLESCGPIDWFFIDPARRGEHNQKVFRIDDCTPNLLSLQEQLLQKANKGVLVKYSPLLDLTEMVRSLDQVAEVHVVSVDNDCKELLIIINKEESERIEVKTLNFQSKQRQAFDFGLHDESETSANFSLPKQYLYEPNSAVLKAGAFKVLTKALEVDKLHSNSHLYTSDSVIENFPGRKFKILAVEAVKKGVLKKYSPTGKANITTRNFPMTVNQIKKKIGAKDGGELYVFATTLIDEKKVLVFCEKV